MNINDFKKFCYTEDAPKGDKREIFNCRNSVFCVNDLPVDILFIGDSITERFEIYPYFNKYGTVVNRGIGGEKTSELKKRFNLDAINLKPKVCVLAEGVNNTADLWRKEHGGQKVSEQDVNAVLENFKSDMSEMIDLLISKNIIPVVGSVLPIGVKDCRNAVIIKENQILKELCSERGVVFVDYYSALVSEDGITLKDVTFGDDLHPHVLGYNLMAELLYPVFDKIFNKNGR